MTVKLKKYLFISLLFTIILSIGLLIFQNFSPNLSQDNITVSVSRVGEYSFKISLDTHSGSLDYDLKELSYIHLFNNSKILPLSWNGTIGGHHVVGYLDFPEFGNVGKFELIITGIGTIPIRTFTW